jgi:anion-transporting  ArsA/GET3 family ATPase
MSRKAATATLRDPGADPGADPAGTSLTEVLDHARLLVTCGPGGVGKTSTAAALALAASRRGRRVIVVTVDPARRLADALGIAPGAPTHEPHRVETSEGGSLDALMLDAQHTFDQLITEQIGDPARAAAVLANPVYRGIAGSFGGAQEYMAIERLHQLHVAGQHDLVVIDTPPSRHAIDLLEAPDRLVAFFGNPIYRALTLPGRSFARVTSAATGAFVWVVRRLAGPQIVEDTIEFFRSLSGIEAGLRDRAAEVAELLRGEDAAFVVVSSPRGEAVDEATHLSEALSAKGFPLAAVVVNLVHPAPGAVHVPDGVTGDLADLLAAHTDLTAIAVGEAVEIDALAAVAGGATLVRVPMLDDDVHDLAGLARLGELLLA